ncbi:MAG: hypothetical protein Satyrvirus7_22 [Satyrvirus sp.]|uniref:Uncharacterized protein n=1 Tax=Satyrvirus sp. TaxID=2487771 RepID=A0A3G5ADM6_9VIRU|nr:MAG: hypothetical protein Satyrvirus7_22 [Satyrvirus sp.]
MSNYVIPAYEGAQERWCRDPIIYKSLDEFSEKIKKFGFIVIINIFIRILNVQNRRIARQLKTIKMKMRNPDQNCFYCLLNEYAQIFQQYVYSKTVRNFLIMFNTKHYGKSFRNIPVEASMINKETFCHLCQFSTYGLVRALNDLVWLEFELVDDNYYSKFYGHCLDLGKLLVW